MKISYLFFIVLLVSAETSSAQHFSFFPDRLLENNVSPNEYSNHIIYMENLTGGELILGWEKISMDFPAEWEADLCDYVGCYMGVPENGTMLAISDTVKGYLKLTINPNGTSGNGTAVFKVFDNKHPEEVDTCTFIIHATEVTSVEQKFTQSEINVYPMPASDFIHVDSDVKESAFIKIYDLQGKLQLEQKTEGKINSKISLLGIPKGVYFLQLTTEKETIGRKKIIIQ